MRIDESSFRSSFVLGFHGCDRSTSHSILTGKSRHLRLSENAFDWLGSGIYFWESSHARASEYAVLSTHRPSPGQGTIRKPAVLGAIIDLGNCLDLLDAQYFSLVTDGYLRLKRIFKKSGSRLPVNRAIPGGSERLLRNLDCSVINLIHATRRMQKLPAFDSVRAAFIEGEPLYEGAGFYDKNHIQICVRNSACIKGYFRPILP